MSNSSGGRVVGLADNASIDQDTMSIGMWVKASTADGDAFPGYSRIAGRTTFSNGWQIDTGGSTPRNVRSRLDSADNGGPDWSDSPYENYTLGNKPVFNGEWRHLAVTVGSGTARFYVDGSEVDTQAYFTGAGNTFATDETLEIRNFNGLHIDDFRFYDRELTAQKVATWHSE